MSTPCFYPMLTTSFNALYAASKIHGLKAFSTLQEARTKVRPAIFVARHESNIYFAPVTSHPQSLSWENMKIDLRYVPQLKRQSYVDADELWCIEEKILHKFKKCLSYSVDKTYVDTIIQKIYQKILAELLKQTEKN